MRRDHIACQIILPPGSVRLLLAFIVIVSHVSRFDVGQLAVIIFFFLSGYWVSRIWKEEFQEKKLFLFYLSRWLRIMPLYLLVLIAAAIGRGLPLSVENFALLGVASEGRDPTGVAWSIDVELQFYILLPALVLAFRKLELGIVVIAALTIIGWWLHYLYNVNIALMYLPSFGLGMIVEKKRWSPSPQIAIASLCSFVAFTCLIAFVPYFSVFLNKELPHPFDSNLFGMLWMIPVIPYICTSLSIRSSKLDRDIGNWSYPLYLVHFSMIQIFVTHGASKWLGALLAFPIAIALFYGPDRFFERNRRKLISRGATNSNTSAIPSRHKDTPA